MATSELQTERVHANRGVTNLVLNEELDTLNGGSGRLGDGGGHTAHQEIDDEGLHIQC